MLLDGVNRARVLAMLAVSGFAGLGGLAMNMDTAMFMMASLPIAVLVVWLIIQPAMNWSVDGALAGAAAGIGPAMVLGQWAWHWSGFCVMSCDGVQNDPMAFFAWAAPVFVGAVLLGILVSWLKRPLVTSAEAAPA